jgi:hypothetical protein
MVAPTRVELRSAIWWNQPLNDLASRHERVDVPSDLFLANSLTLRKDTESTFGRLHGVCERRTQLSF